MFSSKTKLDVEKDIEEINNELIKLKDNAPYDEEIVNLINEIIETGGKRIRPLITLLCYEMISNKKRDNTSFAAACAIEIIHNASLLIDDIFDKDIFRRKKKSFYLKFSTFSAISMSYSLSSLAFGLALKTKLLEIVEELTKATQNLAISLFLEQKFRNANTKMTQEEALLLIDRKTTTLFEAASVIGVLLNQATQEDREKMKDFGKYFGRAFQLRDDLLSITATEEEIGKTSVITDIKNRIQTYIVLVAMEQAAEEDKKKLEEYYIEKKELDVEKIRTLIKRSGAIKTVAKLVNEYIEKAMSILKSYPESTARNKLIEITRFLSLNL
ncbi:MAG: polyprenyl synthetase family protein [Candidatus Heimdallarchaeum aukensis]|uniref:Polyprenyl synthetase family protein n=1 Tax=Candidatus Heimdallarchaeum aukensis TaxID=2876573 RepID=A0A9Y1FLK4_9ARCH|nr:MAG: polyprenyl synthetase family protein [Candidatus Heimdallarchaeum aukensis]